MRLTIASRSNPPKAGKELDRSQAGLAVPRTDFLEWRRSSALLAPKIERRGRRAAYEGQTMLVQLLVGGAASLVNIAMHSLWTVFLEHSVRRFWARRPHPRFLRDRVFLMMGTVAILMVAHVAEVLVWAATYAVFRITPAGASHVYLAFVNYTTLGYGDVVPLPPWQLLGPITALNGILLIGWSTAVLFDVVRTMSAARGADGSGLN